MFFLLNLNLTKLSEILYLWRFLVGIRSGGVGRGQGIGDKLKLTLYFLMSDKSLIISVDFCKGEG